MHNYCSVSMFLWVYYALKIQNETHKLRYTLFETCNFTFMWQTEKGLQLVTLVEVSLMLVLKQPASAVTKGVNFF